MIAPAPVPKPSSAAVSWTRRSTHGCRRPVLPPCYYHELSSSLPPILENRKYYSDKSMTVEIQPEQLYRGEFKRIFTMRYHDEHCLFQWRKLQYAFEHKMQFIDSLTIDFPHSKHCADQLAEGPEPHTGLGQEIVLGFYHCHSTTFGLEK
ncbi:hypothetical protein B0T17DRAFT_594768 [Bombardia bombarda]|uniref:Uncharacterized protein n=1 Tax=Bombardia bombarda TaxID=252184 RepID=A0AA39XJ72_9PEZI|nr:hypothetical protein B0T17DRAFT_594768 [Bombardia bombarda]